MDPSVQFPTGQLVGMHRDLRCHIGVYIYMDGWCVDRQIIHEDEEEEEDEEEDEEKG